VFATNIKLRIILYLECLFIIFEEDSFM
jgi:hypothetical protein